MLKAIMMFVFGNALWDKLVEFFGSPEAVIEAAVILIGLLVVLKFFREILGFVWLVVLAYVFWTFLR